MHPVLIQIGWFRINSWGFMLALAVVVTIIGVGRRFDQEGYRRDMVLDMILLMVVCGVIGGRAAYIVIYEWTDFLHNPLAVLSLRGGGLSGLVWYGALLGGLIPFLIYLRKKSLPFWKIADIFAPYLALGYALVRIGCFLAGCCYGRITSSPLGMVFPTVDTFARHPTQLYSSALNLILFAFLAWFYPRRRFPGQVFTFYIIGYALYRFVVEFFRDSLIMVGPISLGQVYTLGLMAVGLVLYYYLDRYDRKWGI